MVMFSVLSHLCLTEEQCLLGEQSNFQQLCLLPVPLSGESVTARFGTRENMAGVKKISLPEEKLLFKLFLLEDNMLLGWFVSEGILSSPPSYLNSRLQIILATQWKSFCFYRNSRAQGVFYRNTVTKPPVAVEA